MKELQRQELRDAVPSRHQVVTAIRDVTVPTTTTRRDGTITVTVVGEVDARTAPALRSSLDAQIEKSPSALDIDLSRVQFLGAAGLAVLVETQKRARTKDVDVRLIATSRAVLRPLRVTGLIDLFTVADRPVR